MKTNEKIIKLTDDETKAMEEFMKFYNESKPEIVVFKKKYFTFVTRKELTILNRKVKDVK